MISKELPGEQLLVAKQGPFIPYAEETIIEVVKQLYYPIQQQLY